jgi:parallel beta-helix repeat protein
MKKTARVLVFLLLASTCLLVASAKAEDDHWPGWPFPKDLPHIVINSDGSIEPSNVSIKRVGGTFFFTGDISNYSIYVKRENITIDGKGFTLLGNRSITPVGLIAARGICLICQNNVTIKNLNIELFENGIWNEQSNSGDNFGVTITNNRISGCDQGITFVAATNNSIVGNEITSNGNGINLLSSSCFNSIRGNIIANNSADGIFLQWAPNTVTMNIISGNKNGVNLGYWWNTFIGNNITRNELAVLIDYSNNTFYNNNFVDNLKIVGYGFEGRPSNFWDSDTHGNYWSDYSIKYPNASEVDASGIGDTPYVIDGSNTDHHPLIKPFNIPGINIELPKVPETLLPTFLTPPVISILSPANTTYTAVHDPYISVPLTFETNASLSWVGYSLDGDTNVTVSENGTIIDIPAESRSLSLYANDTAGNWATPQTVYYSVAWNGGTPSTEPFPWLPVAAAFVGVAAVVAVAALVRLKKLKR